MTRSYDTIVIGGGHNGLITAACLAKRGKKVLVVEKRDRLGGLAASEEFYPGYRTAGTLQDTGGVRTNIVQHLELSRFGLEFLSEPAPVFAPSHQGSGLLLHHDPQKAHAEIQSYSKKDAQTYAEFRAFLGEISPFLERIFNRTPPQVYALNFHGLWDVMRNAVALRLLGKKDMLEILRVGPMCVADWLNEWFESDLLKAALAGPAVYGSFAGPWSPSTNANFLIRESMNRHHVLGGPAKLIESLEKACNHLGVEFRTGDEVTEVLIANNEVQGVLLRSGQELVSKTIAASCDPKQTFLKLIAADFLDPQIEERMLHYRCRGVTGVVHLALNSPLDFACRPELQPEYVRIAESLDAIEKAFDPVKYGEFAKVPALEIHVPSVSDSSLCDHKGHHVASVLVHYVPYDLKSGWSESAKEQLLNCVLNRLKDYCPTISNSLVGHKVYSPADLEREFNLSQGQIHHGEMAADQIIQRPIPECSSYKTPIRGLYLCGSGSHPGGGLTGAPGFLASEKVTGRQSH